jgi:hypothetical protein
MTATTTPITFEALTTYDNKRLEPFMTSGPSPAIDDLLGFDFQGWNIASTTTILGTRKFFKGFFGTAGQPTGWGYNMPAVQNAREAPWSPKLKDGQPTRYFFYKVLPGTAVRDAVFPKTLVVDYRGWPKYFVLNPVKYTVDYLVRPDPANRDLLVGKSYSQVLGLKIFLGFFILKRYGRSGYAGPAGMNL